MTRSVVVPVYRNEATLPESAPGNWPSCTTAARIAFEMVFVVDGSPDNSYAVLKLQLARMPFPSQLISLSRNFRILCGDPRRDDTSEGRVRGGARR